MPELPEVETIRRRLNGSVKGRKIERVRIASERTVQGSAKDFVEQLEGARIVEVKRRAKHLLFDVDKRDGASSGGRATMLVHLRMTGDLVVVGRDSEPRFLRIAWDLDDGQTLAFVDSRHLGTAELVDDPTAKLAELGPEPLDEAFTPAVLRARLTGNRPIKAALMDQTVIAGVGNIYADEALFRAKLSPLRKASSLSDDEVATLHREILGAFNDSIATLEIDYHGDVPWRWQNRAVESPFLVYDRGGEPCLRCGATLTTLRVGGRTSVACPVCQLKKAAGSTKKAKPSAKKKRGPSATVKTSRARAAKRSPSSGGGKRGRAR